MKINRRGFVKLSSMSLASMPFLRLPDAGAASVPSATDASALYPLFKNPSGLSRPFVRWWWNGNRVEKNEILRELDMLKEIGIGGVEINAIEFPETADPMQYKALDWLSKEWVEMVQTALTGARERGIVCDIIVGSGWPFGAEFLNRDEQTRMMTLGTRVLKGPKRYEISRQELVKEVEPPIMSKRAQKEKELVALRLAPERMEEFKPGIDLNTQLDHDTITIDVPEGDYVLYYLVKLIGFESVIHGAPGANGPVLNHFNKAAVEKYLNRMSEALTAGLGSLGKHFRSFFVDSMELEGANWCDDMPEQFARRRGYSLEPYLPFILFKTGRMGRALDEQYGTKLSGEAQDTINRVRYDFEITKLELFRERFLETFLSWCKKNGVQSRAQAYGREYHPLNSSLLIDIPECETWLRPWTFEPLKDFDYREGRAYTQINKYVSSAAHLAGKRLISCEELTNTQLVFNATLERLKMCADQSNISGVTHSVFHGFNYSPKEAAFPGWVRYGTFFNERNPWWPYLKRFVDYKSRLSAVFQNSELHAEIAVMHPLADMWGKYGIPWDPNPERAYPQYVFNVWEAIHQSGNSCDYVSELILQQASFAEGKMSYGPRSYKTLILIEVESMEPQTAEALRRFADAGGQIIFVGKQPVYSSGLADHKNRDKAVQDTIASITERHPERAVLYPAPDPGKSVLDWYKGLQSRFKLEPYVRFERPVTAVSQLYYKRPDMDIFFIANSSLIDAHEFTADFKTSHKTAWLWDPETGERYVYPTAGSGHTLRISLAPAESRLIVFDDAQPAGKTYAQPRLNPAATTILKGPWKIEIEHVNGLRRSLTLEQLVDFSQKKRLQSFAGVIWYEIPVELKDPRAVRYLNLGKVHGVSEVVLNGKSLGVKWYGNHIYDIGGATKQGTNLLRVKVSTTLGNYMKSLPHNKDGVKWMKKQPVYPTGMLGPVSVG